MDERIGTLYEALDRLTGGDIPGAFKILSTLRQSLASELEGCLSIVHSDLGLPFFPLQVRNLAAAIRHNESAEIAITLADLVKMILQQIRKAPAWATARPLATLAGHETVDSKVLVGAFRRRLANGISARDKISYDQAYREIRAVPDSEFEAAFGRYKLRTEKLKDGLFLNHLRELHRQRSVVDQIDRHMLSQTAFKE